ncbi:nucleoside diphosphate kinase [Enterocytozoon bieneusi H348]|nr:nucleoside diphosphate kinase [Enterocytozoon bieneusi H348]|eukprot:XP_002650258.1 nucleoside diphosphate kinase [Enterocytozoon bieneusi H348]
MEQTFVMIKPEGVKRRLIGEIIKRFEQKGLYIVNIKVIKPSLELLKEHYSELQTKPFFQGLIEWMSSGEVIPMILEGKNAVKIVRKMVGATNPMEAEVGTIRSDFACETGKNIVHASDSILSAEKEIKLWFGEVPNIIHFENNNLYE